MDFAHVLFLTKYLLIALLLLLCACGLGSWLLKMPSVSLGERVFFQGCLGLGIWSYAIFFLGLCSLLYQQSLLLVVGFSLVGAWRNFRTIKLQASNITGPDRLFLLALLSSTVPSFVLSLYPPHSCDDTMYHLAAAQLYSRAHALVVAEYTRFPFFPELMEMLYSGALCFKSEISAQLICCIANVLILVGIYSSLRAFVNGAAGLLGVAVWLSSQLAFTLASTTFVEIPTGLFCLASSVLAVRLVTSNDNKFQTAMLAGVFAGFGVACKYTAIPNCIGIFIALVLVSVFERRHLVPLKHSLIYAAAALTASLPWFIRNYFYTGNPTFPYLSDVFGHGTFWNAWDYEYLSRANHVIQVAPINVLGFCELLWRFSFDPIPLNEFQHGFTPFFLPGTICATIAIVLSSQRAKLFVLSFPVLVSFSVLFLQAQNSRFLLIALAEVALYTAWSIVLICRWLVSKYPVLAFPELTIPSLVLGLAITYGPISISSYWSRALGPIPATAIQREDFLSRLMPSYPGYMALNKLPAGRLYAYGDADKNYFYAKGLFMGDLFGPGSYSRLLPFMGSGKNVYLYMQMHRVNYFLVNTKSKFLVPLSFFKDAAFEHYFTPIFKNDSCVLYKVNGIECDGSDGK